MVILTIWQDILYPGYVGDEQNQCTKLRVQRYYLHEWDSLSYYLQYAVDVALSSYISESLTKQKMGNNVHCQVLGHRGYVKDFGRTRNGGPFFVNDPHPLIDTAINIVLHTVDVFATVLRQQSARDIRRYSSGTLSITPVAIWRRSRSRLDGSCSAVTLVS